MERFGEKLQILRKKRSMSLRELARATDYVTHSYLSEIEAGKKKPSLELVIKVARLFDVTTDQLLFDELEICQ